MVNEYTGMVAATDHRWPDIEQFSGCLIGQCLGDAAGAPVEGLPPADRLQDQRTWGFAELVALAEACYHVRRPSRAALA